ncbi:MAG TPA: amidohydrolase family protein [Candidatus Caenarcaniphilales bacterium]|nr:amidohydrolase family protein [Candidatus Caenarcaniphilales bacterium]
MPDRRTLLIKGGEVHTVDSTDTVLPGGWILVDGASIAAVGPVGEEPAGADDAVDASGCIVVPGFVNTHQHLWYSMFKGLGGGMRLEQWIQNLLAPTTRALKAPDLEAGSRLACLEMVASGTTTCLHHSVTDLDEDGVEATLRPSVESGMRQVLAKEIRPQPLDDQLALAEAVHARWDGAAEGRIAIAFVIETTAHWVAMGTCSEELVLRGHDLAERLGVRVSTHVAGGTMSREQGYLRFVSEMGRTDIEFLQRLGVLDEHWLLAHAIYPRDRDLELMAAAGVSVSHCPTSEGSRGAGITPVRRMLDEGITVSLGSDGPMVDTSVDMVEQMKAVRLFQNQLRLDPSAITPQAALRMATADGARSIGLDHRIGSLEAGKEADIAVFDLEQPASAVCHEALPVLVHSLRGRDVRWLLVAGEFLVEEGRLVRVDDEERRATIAEASARAAELLQRTDVPAHRQADRRGYLEAIV